VERRQGKVLLGSSIQSRNVHRKAHWELDKHHVRRCSECGKCTISREQFTVTITANRFFSVCS
jgi:Na+-translocating ferredoxin:NAD+ oxidoreductase RnfC subunit